MLKIENTDVYGFEAAIRGMRNPMNSWDKSDSNFDFPDCYSCPHNDSDVSCELMQCIVLGENDLKLMNSLSKAGNDHGKFLRMITVYLDITAPLYWWKEFKTYRAGRKFCDEPDIIDEGYLEYDIEMNSCSTMHKIAEKKFTRDDFSHEHLLTFGMGDVEFLPIDILDYTIASLNMNRERYLATKDKMYWWQMIQLLPSSYNQKRTVQLNYQVLKSMYFARKNHKLDEWRTFCNWIETLPYFKEIVLDE